MRRNRTQRALILGLCFVLMATTFTGCGDTKEKSAFNDGYPENVLRIAIQKEIESADPQMTTFDYLVPMNIFDTPITVTSLQDGGSELSPGLAETWDISADGLTYTLHLRKGVKFHNGEEMVADDFLYTVDRMLDPKRMTKNTDCMNMLKGATEVLEGKATTVEGTGITITDDYTVNLNLISPYAPFLSILSVPGWSIFNREAGEAADEAGGGVTGSYFGAQAEYTIGTGPFILKDWKLNDHIYLEANPEYWREPSTMEGILISVIPDGDTMKMMYESGQLDIFDLSYARQQIGDYQKSDEFKDNIVSKVQLATYYYSFNERIKPFDDVRVRKALQMAIDKETILQTMFAGTGIVANGIFPPGLVGYNKDLPVIKYDKEAAKALLAEAGYGDGFEMTICQIADTPDTLAINEIVQAQLAEIGITVKIEQMDEASWYDQRRTGDLPCYMTLWYGDYNDPDNFLYTFFSKESTVTRSFNYANQDAMERLEQARYMTDPEKRIAEYQDLEKLIIQDEAAWLPLYHLEILRLVNERVQGFVPQFAGWGDCNYYSVSLTPSK